MAFYFVVTAVLVGALAFLFGFGSDSGVLIGSCAIAVMRSTCFFYAIENWPQRGFVQHRQMFALTALSAVADLAVILTVMFVAHFVERHLLRQQLGISLVVIICAFLFVNTIRFFGRNEKKKAEGAKVHSDNITAAPHPSPPDPNQSQSP